MKRTLLKYILKEMWPTYLSTLLIFALIMVSTQAVSVMEWVVERGIHPAYVGQLIFYLLPNIILFALPAASLMAVLIGFLRMSGDNEIIALNACGISLFQVLPSVIILSALSCLIAAGVALGATPWGHRAFRDTVVDIMESRANISVKERVFNEPFDDVIFYVNSLSSREGVMKDVFVVDKRDSSMTNTIVAKEAMILYKKESRMVTIEFKEGTVFAVDTDMDAGRTMQFRYYDLNLSLNDFFASMEAEERTPKELYVPELLEKIRHTPPEGTRYYELVIKLLEGITIPVAVFFMGLIGAPLGAQIRSRGRSLGIGLGLGVFLVYYLCLMGAKSICEQGGVPPSLGMWLPNLFLAGCCVLLLRAARTGEYANVDQWLESLSERLRHRGKPGQGGETLPGGASRA